MEGERLLQKAIEMYQGNKSENAGRTLAYENFSSLWDEMESIYSIHRKKSKIIFKNNPGIQKKLLIAKPIPETFESWIQSVNIFYMHLFNDPILKKKVLRLKITPDEIQEAIGKLEKLEKSRSAYILEKGEAQNATQLKNEAFTNLEKWMSDFFAVAKIALANNPQLLEALGKIVKR